METEKRSPLRHDIAEFLRANFHRRRPLGGYKGKQTADLGRLRQSRCMSPVPLQVLRSLRGEKADPRKHNGLYARSSERGGGRRPRRGGCRARRFSDWRKNILPDSDPRRRRRVKFKNAETLVKNFSLHYTTTQVYKIHIRI